MISIEEIKKRAENIANQLKNVVKNVRIISTTSKIGSGSFAVQELDSYAVSFQMEFSPDKIAGMLREYTPSVFVRIKNDDILIDPRTLMEGEDQEIVNIMKSLF